MSRVRVEFDLQYSGQKRAYADTTSEGILTIENDWKGNGFEPWDCDDDYAKRFARPFIPWTDEGEGDWFSTRLRTFQRVGPGQWYVLTVRAYDD